MTLRVPVDVNTGSLADWGRKVAAAINQTIASGGGGGGGGTTTNAATFNNSGLGAASGTTFDGSVARTISYNTVGAQPLSANLTTYAGIAPSANVQTILGAANYAAIRTSLSLTVGTDVQAFDADLSALAANSTDGFWTHTGAGTGAARTLTAPAAGITITNPAGVAGNPTFALADDLGALEALSGTNTIYYRSAASTWTGVTFGSFLSFSGGTLSRNKGTSFPGSPASGDFYYRTDRNIEYFYDGTRWLSTQLFSVEAFLSGSLSYTATSSNQHRICIPKHGATDIYVEKIILAYILVGTGNWTVAYNWSANAGSGATIGSGITVATNVSGTHYYTETAIGSVLSNPADIDFNFTENSGTATFFPMPSVTYRLVG